MTQSPIAVSIDLAAPGKRIGHLELVGSDDEHAYGVIPVPIAVIANGKGPSALVTAGVHGDEYEGQVLARRTMPMVARGDYVRHVGRPMGDDEFRAGS